MSLNILGISAFYHDSGAAILKDGEIIAAVQEERFTRKKFDPRFPTNAINYCLEEGFIEVNELDAIVFYDNPYLTLDRVIKSILTTAPNSLEQWKKAAKSVLGVKMFIKEYIQETLKTDTKILFTKHHPAHAASAFYPSPYPEAAFLTLDGVGEWETTTIGYGDKEGITTIKKIDYPHSIGLLYSAFTYYTGFRVNSGEYKLMGLAPYGEPKYVDLIKDKLVDILPDGSFRLNTDYFGFLDKNYMTNEKFHDLFGGPPRDPKEDITEKHTDIAASIQKVTEEIIIKLAKTAKSLTNYDNLVLAGGVALNSVANGLLIESGIFDNIWIQPAAGDAGGALGAALLATYEYFDLPRTIRTEEKDTMKGSFLGPKFSKDEIKAFLDEHSFPYSNIEDSDKKNELIANYIADGLIIGYFSGRMEWGPRVLGARSILGDARNSETQLTMNLKIKYRESFRPFAPSVLYDSSKKYFDLDQESPYMLLVVPVNQSIRKERTKLSHTNNDLLEIVKEKRSTIPAVTHVDYSARIQTVNPKDKEDYYNVIKKFEDLTGCGVIVNTSFNVRGEPIVCSPQEAYNCFMNTEMDILVLEDFILYKNKQPKKKKNVDFFIKEDTKVDQIVSKDNKYEKSIEKLYNKKLIQIADNYHDKGLKFFPLGPEDLESYFKNNNDSNTNIFEIGEDNTFDLIRNKWKEDNLTELVNIVDDMRSLAEKLKKIETTSEVSPYIYAMF